MKHYRRLFVLFIFTASALSFYSCKNSTTGPEELQLSRRDYTWMVDTVRIPYSDLTRLWGSAYNDVWISGHTASYGTNLYHFTGGLWAWDGKYKQIMPFSIFGFGPNDVWMGGEDLELWHYDGLWKRFTRLDIPGYDYTYILDIWGDSPDNVYATGIADSLRSNNIFRKALLFHYDGNNWSRLKIPDMPYVFSRIRRGISESDKYYILGIQFINNYSDTMKIFEYDGKELKSVLTGLPNWDEGLGVFEIGKKLYFVKGSKVYKYRNDKLELFLENPLPNHAVAIWGRNERDIFFAMQDGIAHYNGNDVSYVYKFTNNETYIYDFICLDNSVFVLTFDNSIGANIIIRGKLK